MNFLYPNFLWAISLIAIPIAIHLFNFRKYKKVYFSDISLLKNVNTQTKKQSKLKHILVLISRILALTCLVIAFSYPYKSFQNKSDFNQKFVGIYLDNSLSMENENQNGIFIEQAKEKAVEIVNQYPSDSRFVVTTNSFSSDVQRDLSKAEIQDLILKIKPTHLQKNYAEIYSRQASLMKKFSNAKDVYWLSDLPKSNAISEINIDSSIFVNVVPFLNKENGNLFIDSVWFDSPIRRVNKQELLQVKLINTHSFESNFRIEAVVNSNETKGICNGTVPANSQLIVEVPYMTREPGIKHIELKIQDQSNPDLLFDDTYFLTYFINSTINVMHIFQKYDKNYFKSLLNPIENIKYSPASINSLDYSKIKEQDVIVLENLIDVNSGLIASIQEFIDVGKTVIIFPSNRANVTTYNNLFQRYGIRFSGLDSSKKTISDLNYQHPIFSNVFDEINENINFPLVKLNFNLKLLSNSMTNEIISLSNNQPFLLESLNNEGKLYLFTSSTEEKSSSFMSHALLVPTILRIVERSQVQNPISYTLGKQDVVKTRINNNQDMKLLVQELNHNESFIPGYRKNQQSSSLYFKNSIAYPGNFNLLKNKLPIDGFSFNYSRDESQVEFFTFQEFSSILNENELSDFFQLFNPNNSISSFDLSAQTKGILYWKHFIVLTLLFLGLEILLIRVIK